VTDALEEQKEIEKDKPVELVSTAAPAEHVLEEAETNHRSSN